MWIFEDFITNIQILQKALTKEEIKITRNSIFRVAVALEVFALNYGKHQMTGANSSVEINSRKLGESDILCIDSRRSEEMYVLEWLK